MPRLSPNPSFSSMLFSASQSGCPRSLSRSGMSSSFSKLSLSGPSTPTPGTKYQDIVLMLHVLSWKRSKESNQQLPASESGKQEKLGLGLMVFCLPC